MSAMLLTACGGQKQTGRVVAFGQSIPAGGGLVQSYIKVELDDGTQVRAWLPQDDALWASMQKAARQGKTRVEIQQEKDYWMFVRVVPEGS